MKQNETIGNERTEMKRSIQAMGRKLLEKRGDMGIREASKKIGISPATLSRVERGYTPKLETFRKICVWLKINPNEFLDGITFPVKDQT